MKMKWHQKLKYSLVLGLLGTLILPGMAVAAEENLKEQEVTACIYNKESTEKFTVLFDDELPGIPYMDVKDYVSHILRGTFEEKTNEDGTYSVTNEKGNIFIDPEKELVTIDTFTRLTGDNAIQDGSYMEESKSYCKEEGMTYLSGEQKAVLQLDKYRIDVKEFNGRAYIPLPTLADMFALTYNAAEYVDGTIYFLHVMDSKTGEGYFDRSSIYNTLERDPKVADFTYRELCFAMDYFYGKPSKAEIAGVVEEKGFDTALDEYNDETRRAKELLQSTSAVDFMKGMCLLQPYMEDGGHTVLTYEVLMEIVSTANEETAFFKTWNELFKTDTAEENEKVGVILQKSIFDSLKKRVCLAGRTKSYEKYEHVKTWTVDTNVIMLLRYKDTAVFVFDSFVKDVVEPFKWSMDYAKEQGLKNFVIDLSGNGGGQTDVLEYMLCLMLNSRRHDNTFHLYMESTLAGDISQSNDILDLNLDGSFDDKDKEVEYDFNYAVMTSGFSFSCGNLFPIIAKENGIMILGETSGGGSCVLNKLYTAENHYFGLSGPKKMVTLKGADVDAGASVDYFLADPAVIPLSEEDLRKMENAGLSDWTKMMLYTRLYDLEHVTDLIHEFYGVYSNEWADGKWYGKDGKQTYTGVGGWVKTGSDWTFTDSLGWSPKNQWQKIDGKWYYFDRNGIMEKDAYRNGYYLRSNGAWDNAEASGGWKKNIKGWWYSLTGKDYLKNKWAKIDGKWYWFNASGYMAASEFVKGWWISSSGAQTDPVKYSWHKNSKGWWYGVNKGWYAAGKAYVIDGISYSFDADGYCTNP